MRVGIYNRHWNTFGGGEKHAGAIAACLSSVADVDLVCHEDFSLSELENRFCLQLNRCTPLIVSEDSVAAVEKCSEQYDLWINATFISRARSKARRSARLVFFPYLYFPLRQLWNLMPIWQSLRVPAIFWRQYEFLKSYDVILANSLYTREWIKRWWDRDSVLLHPPVDLIECGNGIKGNLILSVGRFVADGHNKKQHILVKVFKELHDSGVCNGWELHLCGGTHTGKRHQDYVRSIKDSSVGYPIFIHEDIDRARLEGLYCRSSIFWHATGFGESADRHPELFEHFGISTVEAMSAGCIPVVINRGGQREIVTHGCNGFLWDNLDELKRFTVKAIQESLESRLRNEAICSSMQFSQEAFARNLFRIVAENDLLGKAETMPLSPQDR